MRCLNCGKEFDQEKLDKKVILCAGRQNGKSIYTLKMMIKQNCCCENCAKIIWDKLWEEDN